MTTEQASNMIPEEIDNDIDVEADATLRVNTGVSNGHENPILLRRLFVGGLHKNTTDESLESHFKQWGKITNCFVTRDRVTGISRKFGFITYQRAHMVDAAQDARPHRIDGQEVQTKRFFSKHFPVEAETTVNTLYIPNLNDDIKESDLIEHFGVYGNIKKANIVTKCTAKRFAFIEFDDYDAVDKVVILRYHAVKGKCLSVQKALPKEMLTKRYARTPRGGNIVNGYKSYYQGPSALTNGHSGSDNSTPTYFDNWDAYYGSSNGGGPMRTAGYTMRAQGPYERGYITGYGRPSVPQFGNLVQNYGYGNGWFPMQNSTYAQSGQGLYGSGYSGDYQLPGVSSNGYSGNNNSTLTSSACTCVSCECSNGLDSM